MLYRNAIKPLADRLLAALGLICLSPLLAVLAVAIRVRMGGPVIFHQRRIGLADRPFLFRKFRTMTQDRDASGNLLRDDERLTPFGQFLRSSSLDELPQLWNVVRGDMSLIGPRPLLPEYLPRYSTEQRRRHDAKPGITGLAQVTGRNALSWERKFELDVEYVDRLCFSLDMSILHRTFLSVIRRTGISQQGHVTMTPFMGSQPGDQPK